MLNIFLVRIIPHLKRISYVFFISLLCFSVLSFASDDSRTDFPPDSEISTEVLRISSNDSSGLHAVVLSLIGDYNPIVKDYYYQTQQGYYSHSIEIQPDWSWIMTCGLFIVIVFSTFRFIGGIFSCKR